MKYKQFIGKMLFAVSVAGLLVFVQASSARAEQSTTTTNASDLTDQVSGNTDCLILTSYLRFGSRDATTNSQVSVLQAFLSESGYYNGAATGYFGPKTLAAVKAFQSANGISATGYVGALTSAKIKSISCDGSSQTSATATTPTPPTYTCPIGFVCRPIQLPTVTSTSTVITQADYVVTFSKTFTVNNIPGSRILLGLGADNGYSVTVNNINVGSNSGEDNFTAIHFLDITSAVHSGSNILNIRVTNQGSSRSSWAENPAGLIYKVAQVSCVDNSLSCLYSGTSLAVSGSSDTFSSTAGSGNATPLSYFHVLWSNISGAQWIWESDPGVWNHPYPLTPASSVTQTTYIVAPPTPTIPVPSISSISPSSSIGGVTVTINGSNFQAGSTVHISGAAYDQTLTAGFISSSQLSFIFPSVAPGTYNVQVAYDNVTSNYGTFVVINQDQTVVFTKNFSIDNVTGPVLLSIAADNHYNVAVNGTQVAQTSGDNNFTFSTQYDITSALHTGSNQISITVVNSVTSLPVSWQSNPGGVVFRIVDGAGTLLAVSNGSEQVSGHADVVIPSNLLYPAWVRYPDASWVWDPNFITGLLQ